MQKIQAGGLIGSSALPSALPVTGPGMFRRSTRKTAGMALISACLMAFSAILHPKGQEMEHVQDETKRKKDAKSGEPVEGEGKSGPVRNRRIMRLS
jgi:hypothetical protein